MYRTSMDLCNINKGMSIKFGLNIQTDEDIAKMPPTRYKQHPVINLYEMAGVECCKLRPFPFISIDIKNTADRGDSWNSNLSISIAPFNMFRLRKILEDVLKKFTTKNLFFKQSGRLYVNQLIAQNLEQVLRTTTKTIKIVYAVVPDEDNNEIEYEGISFMINSIDNFCLLTYDETEFLLDTLNKIDLNVLTMEAINMYLLNKIYQKISKEKIKELPPLAYSEIQEPEIPETPQYAKLEDPNEIPKI